MGIFDGAKRRIGGLLGGPPPGMQISPEQRRAAEQQFMRENPYGLGYRETDVQPRGPTDPTGWRDINKMIQGDLSGAHEDVESERNFTRLNPPGQPRQLPPYQPPMPPEYEPSWDQQADLYSLLWNRRGR